jgi:hypothetical protein
MGQAETCCDTSGYVRFDFLVFICRRRLRSGQYIVIIALAIYRINVVVANYYTVVGLHVGVNFNFVLFHVFLYILKHISHITFDFMAHTSTKLS